jgi:hypothetical protein
MPSIFSANFFTRRTRMMQAHIHCRERLECQGRTPSPSEAGWTIREQWKCQNIDTEGVRSNDRRVLRLKLLSPEAVPTYIYKRLGSTISARGYVRALIENTDRLADSDQRNGMAM